MEETWSGMITIPYDDFVAGIEAIKTIEILKAYVKNEDYVNEDEIAIILGMPMEDN